MVIQHGEDMPKRKKLPTVKWTTIAVIVILSFVAFGLIAVVSYLDNTASPAQQSPAVVPTSTETPEKPSLYGWDITYLPAEILIEGSVYLTNLKIGNDGISGTIENRFETKNYIVTGMFIELKDEEGKTVFTKTTEFVAYKIPKGDPHHFEWEGGIQSKDPRGNVDSVIIQPQDMIRFAATIPEDKEYLKHTRYIDLNIHGSML